MIRLISLGGVRWWWWWQWQPASGHGQAAASCLVENIVSDTAVLRTKLYTDIYLEDFDKYCINLLLIFTENNTFRWGSGGGGKNTKNNDLQEKHADSLKTGRKPPDKYNFIWNWQTGARVKIYHAMNESDTYMILSHC